MDKHTCLYCNKTFNEVKNLKNHQKKSKKCIKIKSDFFANSILIDDEGSPIIPKLTVILDIKEETKLLIEKQLSSFVEDVLKNNLENISLNNKFRLTV